MYVILDMQALVTALCWRPDGKQLAAGHANGSISILDVETGDAVSENKVHYASIATLQWSDQAAVAAGRSSSAGDTTSSLASKLQLPGGQHGMLPHQRFKRLFAPPELNPIPPNSTEPLPDPYDLCMELAGAAAWSPERPGLSLLCAGDARGHISLWLQVGLG
jgi:WD40 repeat protein